MPALKRIYRSETLKIGGAEVPVLKLIASEKVSKKDINKMIDEMELSDYTKGTFIEYVITEGSITHRKAFGKSLSGKEMAKWPVKLRSIAFLDKLPENIDLNKLEWYEIKEDIYVYEGKIKGRKYAILDTEEGIYLVGEETAKDES